MIRPLSKDERRVWARGTEDIATHSQGFVSIETLAMNRQRYERTLALQDEQIERLVDSILGIDEWMSGRCGHTCPFCKGAIGEHKDDCLRGLAIEIKEAIHGS